MTLVPMGPILRRARAPGYAVAAYNMIEYNYARAIVDGAQPLDAPVIVQVSVKTIRHWGYKQVAAFARFAAGDVDVDVDVPVALHLDHCKDADVIKGCIDAGWTSVMFDGSALLFAENLAPSRAIYALTEAAGVGLEAEIGAIGGVEDAKFVAEVAIGTAYGFYKGAPKIAYDLLSRIAGQVDIPIVLHGGTGLSVEQFDRCIASGCARVNISTMHKRMFIEGFTDLKLAKPKPEEPLPFIAAQYDAMKSDVTGMIRTFGSAGRAADARTALDTA